MARLPLSEAKARLFEIADEVARTHERVLITNNGRGYIVLMSVADLESIEATMELLADPEAQRRVAASEREISSGDTLTPDEVRALMNQHRGSR
jgi:antitoxin YefM